MTAFLSLVFFALIIVAGLAAANLKIKVWWVIIGILALMAFRATMPVYIEDCVGISECGKRGHMEEGGQ